MSDFLLLVHGFLTFVKSYCFLPLTIAVATYAAGYSMSIRNSAWSDIRNVGTGLRETNHLVHVIFWERRSKRDLLTMIYVFALPPIIVLLVLSLIYG
jgi:hypothetical protein